MTDLYTIVDTGNGKFACHGRVTRDEAIEEARAAAYHAFKEAETFLATPPDQLSVKVVRGSVVQRFVEDLPPSVARG